MGYHQERRLHTTHVLVNCTTYIQYHSILQPSQRVIPYQFDVILISHESHSRFQIFTRTVTF